MQLKTLHVKLNERDPSATAGHRPEASRHKGRDRVGRDRPAASDHQPGDRALRPALVRQRDLAPNDHAIIISAQQRPMLPRGPRGGALAADPFGRVERGCIEKPEPVADAVQCGGLVDQPAETLLRLDRHHRRPENSRVERVQPVVGTDVQDQWRPGRVGGPRCLETAKRESKGREMKGKIGAEREAGISATLPAQSSAGAARGCVCVCVRVTSIESLSKL